MVGDLAGIGEAKVHGIEWRDHLEDHIANATWLQ